MTKREYCQLWLTCEDKKEASKIAKTLLNKHLIACAKQIPVSADFHWQNKMDHANEILLLMESRVDLFDKVEAEVAKLHSYDTFVLEAIPINKISKEAEKWLNKEARNGR